MPVWTEIPLVPNWFLKEMIDVFIFKMEQWSLIFFSESEVAQCVQLFAAP